MNNKYNIKKKKMSKEMREMVELFQCPGCVCGKDTQCGNYNYDEEDYRCVSHVLGTQFGLGNSVALGLPKGFNKPGFNIIKGEEEFRTRTRMDIRLFLKDTYFGWDKLNIPVWAMEKDGFLFVRTFAPRINQSWVDVIKNGKLEMCPQAINVADFIDEID